LFAPRGKFLKGCNAKIKIALISERINSTLLYNLFIKFCKSGGPARQRSSIYKLRVILSVFIQNHLLSRSDFLKNREKVLRIKNAFACLRELIRSFRPLNEVSMFAMSGHGTLDVILHNIDR